MGNASNLARHIAEIRESERPEIISLREMMKKAF
jgi:hypothetical protein